jgi:integrase
MPINDRSYMTWEPAKDRWRKMYKGHVYTISCRELGRPATKEASYQQANAWWKTKQAEIDGVKPVHLHAETLQELRRRRDWAVRHVPDEVSELNAEIESVTNLSGGDDTPGWWPDVAALSRVGITINPQADPWAVNELLGPGRTWGERSVIDDQPSIPTEKTIGGLITRYLAGHDLRRIAGSLSVGEYSLIHRHTSYFGEWVGTGNPVAIITPHKWEDYWRHLLGRTSEPKFSATYASKYWKYARRFLRWLGTMSIAVPPSNLDSRDYQFPTTTQVIIPYTVQEVRTIIDSAPGQLKLHLLLMLNCGFTQSDISALTHAEVNYETGRITRQRGKTKKHHGKSVPTVQWRLWPDTLALLRNHRSTDLTLALTTNTGRTWVEETIVNGMLKSRDGIQSNFRHLQKRLHIDKPLKVFRKTSASMLDTHSSYGRYAQHFLGHAPDSVAARHYVTPSQAQFEDAVQWLGEQFGFIK